MDSYDYRKNVFDDLSNLANVLSYNEAEQAAKAIQAIQEGENSARQYNYLSWFRTAILPVLKDFAQLNFALLEVEVKDIPIIMVFLRNTSGFSFTESCIGIKAALSCTTNISVEKEGSDIAVALVFDCRKIL